MFKRKKKTDIIDDGIKIVGKKITAFYKLHFFISSLFLLALIYFLILVPIKPQSFSYVTNKINESLQASFDENSSIADSTISFTLRARLRVVVRDFRSQKIDSKTDNREFEIPKIAAEFSLFRLAMLNFSPSKIEIIDPEFTFFDDGSLVDEGSLKKDLGLAKSIKLVANFLFKIQQKGKNTKKIEIKNAKFNFKKQSEVKSFVLKNSKIRIFNYKDGLVVNFVNILSFGAVRDVAVGNSCNLSEDLVVKCDSWAKEFSLASLANICHDCKDLEGVNAKINIASSFVVDEDFEKIDFNFSAQNGDFFLPKVFKNKVIFSDLVGLGDYNLDLDRFNLSQFKAKLNGTSEISLSYLVRGFLNKKYKNSKINIDLKNVAGDDIDGLWPLFLPKQNIRKWVANHVKKGVITKADLKMETVKSDGNFHLENLESKVNFENLDVNYSDYFPVIENSFGVAIFSKKSMDVIVESANVLDSKISNSRVFIEDFKVPELKIHANIVGDAGDVLRHANYSSKGFSRQVGVNLNGDSESFVKIALPLKKKINLKNTDIFVAIKARKIRGKYSSGKANIEVKKKIDSDNFIVKIDLKDSMIYKNHLGVNKNLGQKADLNFDVKILSGNRIAINNAFFKAKNPKKYIFANLIFGNKNGELRYLNLRNKFGKNNYRLVYGKKKSGKNISLKGFAVDLSGFLSSGSGSFGGVFLKNVAIDSSLKRVYLADKKRISDFKFDINCRDICKKGSLSALYNKGEKLIELNIAKLKKKDEFYTISGDIFDSGFILDALNISDKISLKKGKIQILQKPNEYIAKFEAKDDFTFYENNVTKKFEKDDLYSKIKDKIFSNHKTVFTTLKLDFTVKDEFLNVDSFIANNYKIGVTAKGFYNLSQKNYSFKGMIIPGFVINNLFGIGKIPLIGGVIRGLLTGEEGGGLFGIKYQYSKKKGEKEASFTTNKVSAFVPVTIRNLFD